MSLIIGNHSSNTPNFSDFEEFLKIYKLRPIKDKYGGMQLMHMFNVFYFIKKFKPKHIIESGVNKGNATFF